MDRNLTIKGICLLLLWVYGVGVVKLNAPISHRYSSLVPIQFTHEQPGTHTLSTVNQQLSTIQYAPHADPCGGCGSACLREG